MIKPHPYLFSGVAETWFTMEGMSIGLIDVGGQRDERKKWLHCFESIEMVLFIVALSEYDQMLEEDPTTNRMKESLNTFGSICENRWLKDSPTILFFNKKDVFDEKIKYSPLRDCFSHYEGSQDVDKACTFIAKEFRNYTESGRSVYHHFTCAKDSTNIAAVFDTVVDVILKANRDVAFL